MHVRIRAKADNFLLLTTCFLLLVRQTFGSTILRITRNTTDVDTFTIPGRACRDKDCHPFGAFLREGCTCACTGAHPVLLQNEGTCKADIDGCRTVPFRSASQPFRPERIPVLGLVLEGLLINPGRPMVWQDVGIVQDPSVGDQSCSIASAGYLTESGWRDLSTEEGQAFRLDALYNQTFLRWLGHRELQDRVSGKLILVSLSCQHILRDSTPACIAFRVVGTDSLFFGDLPRTPLAVRLRLFCESSPRTLPVLYHMHYVRSFAAHILYVFLAVPSAPSPDGSSEEVPLALIVGVVCGVLLVLTLLTVILAWNLCWKRKKDQLVRKIHLQIPPYLLHQRMNSDPNHIAQSNSHFAQETFVPSTLDAYYQMFNMGIHPTPTSSLAILDDGYGPHLHPLGNPPPPHLGFAPVDRPSPHAQQVVSRRKIMNNSLNSSPTSRSDAEAMRNLDQVDSLSTRTYPPIRKRLYFSPEFLEPDLMADPPPVAEEFLIEVRRMIGMAKNRIRSKRHIPSLLVIPEDRRSQDSEERARHANAHDNHAFETSPLPQRSSNRSSPDQNGESSSNETSGDSGVSVEKKQQDEMIDATMDSLEHVGHVFTAAAVQANGLVWHSEEDEAVHKKVSNWLNDINHHTPPRPHTLPLSEQNGGYAQSPNSIPPSVPPEMAKTPPKGATSPAGLPVSYSLLRRYGLQSLDVTFPDASSNHDDPFVLKDTPSSFPRKTPQNGRVPVRFAFSVSRDT